MGVYKILKSKEMSDSVKLTYNDETFEFPLIEGTEDEKGIDIKPCGRKQV